MVASVVTSVSVVGVRPTIVSLNAEVVGYAERATAGLLNAGHMVESRAKRNMGRFRYKGRAQDATTTWISSRSPSFVRINVGIRGNTFAPEGKTFEVGWRSQSGLQPPTAPIAEWAMKRGIAGDAKEAARIGYVIARAQGKKGYSFSERHWLSDAWRDVKPEVEAIVVRYAASSFASQPRAASGRWVPFA